jgi:SNF2-related domain
MKTAPYAHQVEAGRRRAAAPPKPSSQDVFAYLMEQGTGKTWCALQEWEEKIETRPNLLVIAKAGCYLNWVEDKTTLRPCEVRRHSSIDAALFAWRSGGGKRKKAELDAFLRRTGPKVFAVNVEALSTVKSAREACEQFLTSALTLMVVDEATTIKSDSKRTAEVLRLGQLAAARRLMTGLPTPRSPLDLYYQFDFLDWHILGQRSWYAFRARYAEMKRVCMLPRNDVARRLLARGVSPAEVQGSRDDLLDVAKRHRVFIQAIDVVTGYKNLDELNALIAPYSYRILKDQCLDLPPKVYEVQAVEMTDEQARIYADLRDTATAQLNELTHVTATETIVRVMRLHQVLCGHVTDETGVVREIPTRKPDAVVDLLDECSGKAIVWAAYDHDIRKLVTRLGAEFGNETVAAYWGGNRGERDGEERRWLTDPACRFMIATPAAGGYGNTWVEASTVIYYSSSDNLEHRLQSEDRCHRAGLDHRVTYYDLVVPGTVDEKIVQSMRKKIDLASAVMGDGYREWIV